MADEIIRVLDDFYILSTSARIDDRTRALKHGDTFALFDRFGDIEELGSGELGLYHEDTRFISRFVLRLEGSRPLLLSSTVKDDNAILAVDLMNPDIWRGGEIAIPRGTVHILRSKVLWNETCHEKVTVHNYGDVPIELSLTLEIGGDFADIFEVRGMRRARRGSLLPVESSRDSVTLAYEGLDGRVRRARIEFDPAPVSIEDSVAAFPLRLGPREEASLRWAARCEVRAGRGPGRGSGDAPLPGAGRAAGESRRWYDESAREAVGELRRRREGEPEIFSSNEQFNDWLNRSLADLHTMRTDTEHGEYIYAGIPWYSTAFGRDGIITALECLWFNPGVARGVLAFLAQTQASISDTEQDAQPGKILHETRSGEMAALGEVPFGRYYGTVDATPLFVTLAGAYYRRTGDRDFAESIWPNVSRALDWIDTYGDLDGDGFVEYARRSRRGLVHQGWKDSIDSVFHADGAAAEPPIALCEVQGYVYSAKAEAAALARSLGMEGRARELEDQAEALRGRFEDAFWCEDLSTYALALDGSKRPCRVRTSNAGHCLYAGIASPERAARLAATLTDPAFFSGWGVRTVAETEPRYSPMSYHNGSVWPHDSAIIAAGMARYGLREEAMKILTGLFDASLFFDLHRLPELFCGFPRRPGESPTLYPVSCSPQAWASGAVFLLLQACLGLEVVGREEKVVFTNPMLPDFIDKLRITGLRVGRGTIDLLLTRYDADVGINVLRREGGAAVVALK